MQNKGKSSGLFGRTVLIAPSAARELVEGLEGYGARVITWPEIDIGGPESFTGLDEAIKNLFGYDWLLFRTGHAAEFFLRRFQELGHDVSELDALRVCAIGAATARKLEESQVHIDLIPGSPGSNSVFEAIENYVGGRTALGRLNFLIPRASTAKDRLRDILEEAEARVDVVVAYRTVSNKGTWAQLTALLTGGGIDCVAFDSPSSLRNLAELSDTIELATILSGVQVFCVDESTTIAANDSGLRPLPSPDPTTQALAKAMAEHFHAGR
jgi:uroporphyrinogen III methyltransferase/synthase